MYRSDIPLPRRGGFALRNHYYTGRAARRLAIGELVELSLGSGIQGPVGGGERGERFFLQVKLSEPVELPARLDDGALPRLVRQVDLAVGVDRRRRVLTADPLLPHAFARLGVEAAQQPTVRDHIKFVADEQGRGRVGRVLL